MKLAARFSMSLADLLDYLPDEELNWHLWQMEVDAGVFELPADIQADLTERDTQSFVAWAKSFGGKK